jgi:hypothetical protein
MVTDGDFDVTAAIPRLFPEAFVNFVHREKAIYMSSVGTIAVLLLDCGETAFEGFGETQTHHNQDS